MAARFWEQPIYRLYRHISVRSRRWAAMAGFCDVVLVEAQEYARYELNALVLTSCCVAVCSGLHESNRKHPVLATRVCL